MAKLFRSTGPRSVRVLAMLGFLWTSGCKPDSPAPESDPSVISLTFSPARHDLGRLPNLSTNRVIEVPTTIRNEGTLPVTIAEMISSCSCTAVNLGDDTIAPGAEVVLTTKIQLGNAAEARSSRVTVVAHDASDRASQDIEFVWRTVNPLETDPETCTFDSEIGSAGEATRELALFGQGLALCDVCELKLYPSSPLMNAEFSADESNQLREHPPDQEEVPPSVLLGTITVTVKGGTDPRVYREGINMLVYCEGRELGRLGLRVNWTSEPVVVVTPATFALGFQTPGAKLRRAIILKASDGEAFELTRFDLAEGRDAMILPGTITGRSAVHRVEFEIELPRTSGPWRDHILVESSRERSRTLELPISAIIREADDDAADEEGIHPH